MRASAFWALLVLTAVGYTWDLSASGYANSFYAAAVQAGTKSWKAFFFGSIDSSNFITVDKPPGSLWLMELSGRIFGFSSWSMLVPEALAGSYEPGPYAAAAMPRREFVSRPTSGTQKAFRLDQTRPGNPVPASKVVSCVDSIKSCA